MSLLTRQPQREGANVEVLIKEARALRRRRWLVGISAAIAVAVVVAVSLSLGVARPTKVVRPLSTSSSRPIVNAHALHDKGNVAFISRGVVWTIDGRDGALSSLPTVKGYSPTSPQFSPNGKWLAYLETRTTNYSVVNSLWIARGDGTDVREVSKSVGELVGWSPSGVLAFTPTSQVSFETGNFQRVPDKVELLTPSGKVQELVTFPSVGDQSVQITGATWSPNGAAIAVSMRSIDPRGGTAVKSYPLAGGKPTTWFSINNAAILPGLCTDCGGHDTIATVAGWWRGWGVGFWALSSGMTDNLDDTPVELVASPGVTPRIIGDTLSDEKTVAFSSNQRGELAIVASSGGREFGQGKTVDVCHRLSETCAPIPGASVWTARPLPCAGLECSRVPPAGAAGSGESIDPSWSPNGSLLAYEKAPTVPDDGISNEAWYDAHELYLWNSKTNTSEKFADVKGATVPIWSKNGADLLYVDNNALWIWPVNGAHPAKVAGPLFPPQQWTSVKDASDISFYEQVDFRDQFSWWSR